MAGCRATLLAVSGSRLADIPGQLATLPADATHIVVSIGGNDLLNLGCRLRGGSGNLIARFGQAAALMAEFGRLYSEMCRKVGAHGLRMALCTIYEPPVDDLVLRQLGSAALHVVNAAITKAARGCHAEVVDLRTVCREPADFFDPIHPSAHGADKIAAVLAQWLRTAMTP